MKNINNNKLIGAVIFILIYFFWRNIYANPQCDDYLYNIRKKPDNLEFIECKKSKDMQVDVLEARYRVSGKNADTIEKYLINNFSMPPLKFMCCGWESWPNQSGKTKKGYFKSRDGLSFEINMFSEETLVNSKNKWGNINYFYVNVILHLEEP